MTPHKQLIVHDPANGKFGDCHRTCIATILDVDPLEVPHFCDGTEDRESVPGNGADTFLDRERSWLARFGLASALVGYLDCDLDAVLTTCKHCSPGVPVILGGTSRLGCNHSVVVLDGEIVSDPSGNGIVGPMDDGYYWVTFITVGADWRARLIREAA